MDEPTDQQPRHAEALSRVKALLDQGDVAGAESLCRTVAATAGPHPEQRKLMAALLLCSGRIDDALPALMQYLEERPDDFGAMLLLYRMQHVRGTTEGRQAAAGLAGKLADDLAGRLHRIRTATGATWDQVFADVLLAPGMQEGLRAGLLGLLHQRLLSADQRAALRERLLAESPGWPPAAQLRAAGALLLMLGAARTAMDRLTELSEAGAISTNDYPSVIYAVSLCIGQGDLDAHLRRFAVLDRLYRDWTARLGSAIPPERLEPVERFRRAPGNGHRVAILASPLVNMFHAPTNRAIEIAVSLRRDHGCDVKIFEGGMLQYRVDPPLPIVDFYNCNYATMLRDRVVHAGVAIPKWRSFLDDSQYLKFVDAAAAICAFRPGSVIVVGDASPVQWLLAGRIPVVVIPTNSGAPVGPADRYASLWDRTTLDAMVAAGDWPAAVVARSVFGAAGVRVPQPERTLTREQVVAGADVVLAIVGGRLAHEIRGAFAERLAGVLTRNPGVHLLCIGEPDVGRVLGSELARVAGQVHCQGFAPNLADLMTGCDIFLNPARQGGGTSVAIAMRAECPVLCLATGDGATLLEHADLADDLDDYFARLDAWLARPEILPAIGRRMVQRVDQVLGFEPCMQVLADTVRELAGAASHDRPPA